MAQSSVTIGGGMRIGYGQTTTGLKGLQTTQGSGNTMNFQIVEDLGGGMQALASTQLRWDATSGLNANSQADLASTSGTAGKSDLFHYASVGLKGSMGTIQMGRIGFDGMWAYTGFGSTTQGVLLNTLATTSGGGATEDNQIRYTSPTIGGFAVQLGGAFNSFQSGVSGKPAQNSQQMRVSYANGPITAIASSERANNGSEGKDFGGSYDFKVAKLSFISGKSDAVNGVQNQNYLTLSALVPFGVTTLKLARKNDKLAANKDVTAVGIDYALSKRTVLEANTWKVANDTVNTKTATWFGIRHAY